MAGYADSRVPRGTSHRWEVLISDAEGERSPTGERLLAVDVVGEHRVLRELPAALLREIPLLAQGTSLERCAEYLDLHDPARADFRAEGTEIVRPGQHLVAQSAVGPHIWQELRSACDRVVGRWPRGRRAA